VILFRFLLDGRSRPSDGFPARWTVVACCKTYDVYWYQACYFSQILPGATFSLGGWGFPALAKAHREVSSGEEVGEG
jgi:hypothetical protein